MAQLPIFHDDQDRLFLLRLVERAVSRQYLVVDAFCLMLNHLHLLCQTPRGCLGRLMQILLSRYATDFNQRHGRSGHLFQGRYRALLVEDGPYFLNCSRYIHRNPDLPTLTLQDYPWSSYPGYLGLKSVADWVSHERTLRFFDSPQDYRAFVESDSDLVDPFEHAVARTVFGGDAFIGRIRSRVLEPGEGNEIDVLGLRALRLWGEPASIELVQKKVDVLFRDWSPCQRRRLFIYALREHSWMKNRQIAALFRLTPGATSHAFKSIRHRLRADADLRIRFQHLRHQLPPPRR